MTSSELQFAVIKDELTAMVDDIIRQFLNDKVYEKDQAQNWCNGISDEIIKALHQQQRGFKFVCTCTIFQKGYASMNFSSTCLWNPNQDGSVTVKYENDKMHAFVCLFSFFSFFLFPFFSPLSRHKSEKSTAVFLSDVIAEHAKSKDIFYFYVKFNLD